MTTSEPTTGEIVRALRCVADDTECKECRYKYPVGNVILCDHEQMNGNAADRLESQEQAIEELKSEAIVNALENAERIANLTARAEQAERERDAARKDIDMTNAVETGCGLCLICKKQCDDASNGCFFCKDFEWRGQPQEGE
ncbi:MAG: hypothetical protein ABFC56_09110, partial [Clostridiaceae bacterium]